MMKNTRGELSFRYNVGVERGGGLVSEVERIRLTRMTEKGG